MNELLNIGYKPRLKSNVFSWLYAWRQNNGWVGLSKTETTWYAIFGVEGWATGDLK